MILCSPWKRCTKDKKLLRINVILNKSNVISKSYVILSEVSTYLDWGIKGNPGQIHMEGINQKSIHSIIQNQTFAS